MIQPIDIRDEAVARAALELQKRSYAVEAEIIGYRELPPLTETLEELRDCGEDFRGYFLDGTLAGAISTKQRERVLDIHRLFVGPEYFRRGVASSLLWHVESSGEWNRIIVSTGSKNEPARSLYLSHGFVETGEKEVVPGLLWARFEKVRRIVV